MSYEGLFALMQLNEVQDSSLSLADREPTTVLEVEL